MADCTMELNLKESFDRSCRLCAVEQDVTIMIFSAEAEAMLLQKKLNKYLLIEIAEDDKLPKNICISCCTKLQTVCDFIDTAHKAQETLLNRSVSLANMINNSVDKNNETLQVKSDPMQLFDDESHITEMEVSIDPMTILQNNDGVSSPKIYDNMITENTNCNSADDVSYLHGLEGENVTIKLIKKGDQPVVNPVITEEPKKKIDRNFKPFTCAVCKKGYLTELALKNHFWIHAWGDDNSHKTYKCFSCSEGFELRNDLISHLKKHKSRSTCKVCNRVFRTEGNLDLHMETHRAAFNPYVCKVCGRAYSNSSNLKTHSITHSNERPFKCHLCKKCFKRNQDLKFHINQHTGAKPYKCPFCEKSFASSGNCYSHRSRMHPGRRIENRPSRGKKRLIPVTRDNQSVSVTHKSSLVNVKGIYKYQCQLCDHSFMKLDNFTYHMYQHTGEKPYRCSHCDEEFVTRRGLLLHHDKEHPSKERPLALVSKNTLLN